MRNKIKSYDRINSAVYGVSGFRVLKFYRRYIGDTRENDFGRWKK